jgi:transglutaminase-like putative cysteine protease
MIYDVRQSTTYHYASTVAHAHHILRLTPIDRQDQRALATALTVEPEPVDRREGSDFFGNRITWILLEQPHDTLNVRVAARIVIDAKRRLALPTTPPWEDVRAAAFASPTLAPQSPAHYLFPSRQVSLDPEIRDYAAASFLPRRAILDCAIDLSHRIKSEFVYELGATTASTTPPMSFALRRGVCQDFSHVMISGMRSLGLPAAYVSGYLRTGRLLGQTQLQGADAMHAWVLAWCGEQPGWIGIDPTNDILAGENHVVLAIGRDYADVAPIDGVVFGAGEQKLKVSVQVTPVN